MITIDNIDFDQADILARFNAWYAGIPDHLKPQVELLAAQAFISGAQAGQQILAQQIRENIQAQLNELENEKRSD